MRSACSTFYFIRIILIVLFNSFVSTDMESSYCDGLPVHCNVDYGVRHGDRPWSRAWYEEISPVARHFPGQRALHPLGISYVWTDRHRVVFRMARRIGLPQASFHIAEAVFRSFGYSLPVTVHHNDYNFLVRAGDTSRMHTTEETSVSRWYIIIINCHIFSLKDFKNNTVGCSIHFNNSFSNLKKVFL